MNIKFYDRFDLDKTLDCGQCFRWNKVGDSWSGVVNGKSVIARFSNDTLKIESDLCDLRFWENYFDLRTDYVTIINDLSKIDNILERSIDKNVGIHILNQDPWEVLCSFIISQNNNIKRIKGIIDRLCKNFGDCLNGVYSFPNAQRVSLLNLDDLSVIRAGFRSKYILEASKFVCSKEFDFDEIYKLDTISSMKILQRIKGIGPKVSSCILLFGFHKLDSFPIDTWMKKVMSKFYKGKSPDYFGKYAGIAQQYLFMWSRNNKDIFLD